MAVNPKLKIKNRSAAFILPIVLVMIGLLALTMAGFIFFVRAETAGIRAGIDGKQAQLAAEAGLEELISMLRLAKHDISTWYDNPTRLRHSLVWGDGFDRQGDPVKEAGSRATYFEKTPTPGQAWRYSVVAARHDGPADTIRFGITPETGKLNLNTASDLQLSQLVTPLLLEMGVENAASIVDAILDWRDADNNARGAGAENDYYNTLTPAYNVKNARFDTIEELLLVKGVTGAILWGEDVNRNGVLDTNEDDSDGSFPEYDNGDGVLNHGIAPFLTVFSREPDTALDNKPRIPLSAGAGMGALWERYFPNGELSAPTQQFLMSLQQRGIDIAMLRSPADLYPLGPDEQLDLSVPAGAPSATQPSGSLQDILGGQSLQGLQEQLQGGEKSEGGSESADEDGSEKRESGEKSKDDSRMQSRDDKGGGGTGNTGNPRGGGRGTGNRGGRGAQNANGEKPPEGDGQKPPEGDTGGKQPEGDTGGKQPAGDTGGKQPAGQPAVGGKSPTSQPGQGQQQQQKLERLRQALIQSPILLEEMPIIMDRFTTRQGQQGSPTLIEGMVNINTAPARVLSLIPGITPDAVGAIIATRQAADPATLATTAWPLVSGAVDAPTFRRIAPYITTKSYQFHVEVVGYADHAKLMRRFEWVIEMIGPLAQVKYFRDLSSLGLSWPLDTEVQVVTQP
ncbi:MAG: hypothetical protein ACKVS9_05965 [Phycisphaerae bacterium]